MKNLLILGAGQYGMVAKEIAESMRQFSNIAFLDDNSTIAIGRLNDYEMYLTEYSCAIPAIGNSELRLDYIEKLKRVGYIVPVMIHERAYVSPTASISEGCFIEPMAVIHTDVNIGSGCIISAGTIVNHNAIVGCGCHLNCGTIVMARADIPANTKTDYGQIIG